MYVYVPSVYINLEHVCMRIVQFSWPLNEYFLHKKYGK